MGTTTLETSKGLKDAVADFQEAMAGSDVTISAGGQESHVGDVRKVVEALCETAEQPDPGTDPWPARGSRTRMGWASSAAWSGWASFSDRYRS